MYLNFFYDPLKEKINIVLSNHSLWTPSLPGVIPAIIIIIKTINLPEVDTSLKQTFSQVTGIHVYMWDCSVTNIVIHIKIKDFWCYNTKYSHVLILSY